MQRKVKYAALLVLVFVPFIVWAAKKSITSYMWDSNIQVTTASAPFTEENSIAENVGDAVTVTTDPDNPANPMISLGNSSNDTCGAIWLGGTGTTNVTCPENKCPFGGGFRTYFEFRITGEDSSSGSTDRGDGFTFAFINGSNNDKTRSGGPASGSMGEMMCYAGSDATVNQLGLRYPKMAVEFDLYPNTGTMDTNGCYGGRQDSSSHNNHIALMFWGDNTSGNCPNNNSHLRISYDDNIHGIPSAGSATTPQNTASGSSAYYYRTKTSGANNWLEDNAWHRARVEVQRDAATNTYNVKTWVDCETCVGNTSTCTACTSTEIDNYFKDVLNQYYNASSPRAGSVLPKIQQTLKLSSGLPSFDNVLYGFTVATGGATQTIQIRNMQTYFLPSVACSVTLSPLSASFAIGGGTDSIALTASSNCPWAAVSNDSWITVTSGDGGTGSGTVTYSVAANSGGSRTGTITIGDQTFIVTQTGCTYVVATHACYRSSDRRIYVNANVTGGTPSDVSWTLDGVDQGSLDYISGTLWGGTRSGCGLSNADRTGTVSVGTHTVTVTATGSCATGSDSAQVTRP